MNDIDTGGTNADYFVALITFWVVMVVVVLFVYRYVWPVLEHMYWKTAAKLYWACRNNVNKSRDGKPSLYTHSHISKKGDRS